MKALLRSGHYGLAVGRATSLTLAACAARSARPGRAWWLRPGPPRVGLGRASWAEPATVGLASGPPRGTLRAGARAGFGPIAGFKNRNPFLFPPISIQIQTLKIHIFLFRDPKL
jgi:hypothetical protein